MSTTQAPIAVFVYRRPGHARRLLEALLANPSARSASIYVFSDGPRTERDAAAVEETRRAIRALGLANARLIERPVNLGLARSVIDGVTTLCDRHGRAIVLEDDLVVAPTFLEYMNRALDRYEGATNVFGVSGFMYAVDLGEKDAAFLPFVSSWGWATWARAWRHFDATASGFDALQRDRSMRRRFDMDGNYNFFEMLEQAVTGRSDSWALRWYLSVFMRGGLTLFPARSLVENRGFGEDAEHCTGEAPPHVRTIASPFSVRTFPEPALDQDAFDRVKRFVGRDFTLGAKARAAMRAAMRRVGLT